VANVQKFRRLTSEAEKREKGGSKFPFGYEAPAGVSLVR
jgi:hypothetical protein